MHWTLSLYSLFSTLLIKSVFGVSVLNQSSGYGSVPRGTVTERDVFSPLPAPSYAGIGGAAPTAPLYAVVGGVLAGILLTGILIFGIWMCSIRHRYPAPPTKVENRPTWTKPELGGTCVCEIDGIPRDHPELETGAGTPAELESRAWTAELGDRRSRYELCGETVAKELPNRCSV